MVAEKGDSIKRCCLTRQEFARAELVRFVVSPDGSLVPDLGARLPGRGAWVSAGALAKDGQALGQALKRALKLAQAQELCGETLIQMTRAGLEERLLAGLGLARRSGLIVVGEHQVRAVAQERGAQLRILLQATDGSADGLIKWRALCAIALLIVCWRKFFLLNAKGRRLGAKVSSILRSLLRL